MKENLKGVNELTRIINDFLAEFDAIAEMGCDNAYYLSESKIVYSVCMPSNGKDYFMQNFHKLAPDLECDAFLATILHELGHHETLHMFDEYDEAYCHDYKEMLGERLEHQNLTPEIEEDIYQQYFDLPDEYEATMWAINYIRNNVAKIEAFWYKLKAAVLKFYKLNGVEV